MQDFNFSSPDTSSHWHFIQSYSEIIRAAYTPSNTLLTVNDLKDLALSAKIEGKIAVGLGNYQFNVIDSNAISNGLIQMIDSMYYDVSGRPNHPFLTIHSFIASPLVDSVDTLNVKYDFSSDYSINRSNIALTSLQVDFDDGNGAVNVALNDSVSVNYTLPGYKYLKFIASFSDNSSMITYGRVNLIGEQQVYLKNNATPTNLCTRVNGQLEFWSDLTFQGYDETTPTRGYGEATIYYATNGTCDGVIRKPIIVIDGFDPGDKQDADELYKTYLDRNIPGNPSFATSLRANGYDIIVLNFPEYKIGTRMSNGRIIPVSRDGGADYIERNARVLMKLIDRINTLKEGNEKLVIIGPSMGGLISRYALSYMEQNSMPHQTRLWVSFDSPHKGANIPIGDQWFLDYYAKNTTSEELKENRDYKISSVAAKQMLVHHFLSNSETPAGAPNFRNNFLTALNNLGFPQGDAGSSFRKIALINGSLGGIETNSPEQKAFTFDIRRRKSIGFLGIRWRTWTVGSAKMYFTPSYNNTSSTVLESSFLGHSSGNYKASNPLNSSGYDVAPGGTYETQGILYDEGNKSVSSLALNFIMDFEARFYSVVRDHSFINTKSALAFTGQNQNLSENISTRNLVCTNETPFDSYFGDFTKNREHVELWAEGIDWVTKEINGMPQPPSVKSLYEILGPPTFCTEALYTINGLPAGTTITWSVTGNISIPPSSTGSSVLVSGTNGSGELKATFNSNCGIENITKNITTGPTPVIPTIISSGYITNSSNPFEVNIDICGSDNNNTVQLDFPGAFNLQVYNGNAQINGSRLSFQHVGYGIFSVYLEYQTSCGITYQNLNFNNICPNYRFSFYPNPAEDEIIVSYDNIDENVNETSTKKEFKVELLNNKGEKVLTGKNNGNKSLSLNTQLIPAGTYYLHIYDNSKVIRKQVIIEHKK